MNLNPFRRKNVPLSDGDGIADLFLGWIGFKSSSGEDVGITSSLDVPAVFCAARAVSEGIASMPHSVVRLQERERDGLIVTRPDRKHWAHRLISERPNSWQTPFEFREGMVFNAALAGDAIAVKNEVNGEVRELLPVRAGAWSVRQDTDWSLIYQVNLANGKSAQYRSNKILHLRGPGLNGYEGLPAIRQARNAIGLSMSLEKQHAKMAGAGGTPSGVLSFEESLKPETVVQLKEDWSARYGPNGDGGIAVLPFGAKYQQMSLSLADAQHLESRRFQIEEIGRAFRVQPIMMMQSDKAATFASAEQMFRVHVIHTLGPWVERWEQCLSRDLLPNRRDLRVQLEERGLLRGDFKDQSEYYSTALGTGGGRGWMSVNEVRNERGMNPIPEAWADEVPRGAMEKPRETDDGATSPQREGNAEA